MAVEVGAAAVGKRLGIMAKSPAVALTEDDAGEVEEPSSPRERLWIGGPNEPLGGFLGDVSDPLHPPLSLPPLRLFRLLACFCCWTCWVMLPPCQLLLYPWPLALLRLGAAVDEARVPLLGGWLRLKSSSGLEDGLEKGDSPPAAPATPPWPPLLSAAPAPAPATIPVPRWSKKAEDRPMFVPGPAPGVCCCWPLLLQSSKRIKSWPLPVAVAGPPMAGPLAPLPTVLGAAMVGAPPLALLAAAAIDDGFGAVVDAMVC